MGGISWTKKMKSSNCLVAEEQGWRGSLAGPPSQPTPRSFAPRSTHAAVLRMETRNVNTVI